MYNAMKAFCEVEYCGTMVLDHTPQFYPLSTRSDGHKSTVTAGIGMKAETAYAIGYMKALLERATAELGGSE